LTASSIPVNPSTRSTAVNVSVDRIDGVDYPVYKEAFGDADNITRVDIDNPLPVATDVVTNSRMLTALEDILTELKIANA